MADTVLSGSRREPAMNIIASDAHHSPIINILGRPDGKRRVRGRDRQEESQRERGREGDTKTDR